MIQSAPPASGGNGADGGSGGAEGDEPEARPPWHWVGFGTIATFALWLPLVYLAQAIGKHVFTSRFGASPSREEVDLAFAAMSAMERFRWTAMQTLPHVIAFAVSAFGGGLLVGRFGPGTGAREAALSGLVTALIALAVAWQVVAEGGWGAFVSVAVSVVIAVGFAAWGGRYGAGKRAASSGSAAAPSGPKAS